MSDEDSRAVRFIITAIGCALTLVPFVPVARALGVHRLGVHGSEFLGDFGVLLAALVVITTGLRASRKPAGGGADDPPGDLDSSDGHEFKLVG